MTGLEITSHSYRITDIKATKDSAKHIARLIIDSKDQPQFKFQGHSRAELLIEEADWQEGTNFGSSIVVKSMGPKIKNTWQNGKYENTSYIYPHVKYELVKEEVKDVKEEKAS